jgi:hypothetical protein
VHPLQRRDGQSCPVDGIVSRLREEEEEEEEERHRTVNESLRVLILRRVLKLIPRDLT